MSEYVDFHYMPLEGKITGEQVLKQTEDAINDLGNKVYNLDIDESRIDEAVEKSEQAIETADSALAAVTTDRAVWKNTVAEMKATDIDLGVTAATRGKMVFNDGNGAFYGVRSEKSGDVESDDTVFLNNGNVAERLKQMNVIAKGNNIIYVANVAELVVSEAVIGNVYGTTGYHTPNDGGNGIYKIREKKSSDVEDGGSIIFLDNGNVAELITDGTVNVKQFGAYGDGDYTNPHDDTVAIQAVFTKYVNYKTIVFPRGRYVVTSPIVLATNAKNMVIRGESGAIILCRHNGNGFELTQPGEYNGNVTFENLIIAGPNQGYRPLSDNTSTGAGLYLIRAYENKFNNVYVHGFKYGLYLQIGIGNVFSNGTYFRWNEYGAYLDNGATNLNRFIDCNFRENYICGVQLGTSPYPSPGNRFMGNYFTQCYIESNLPYVEADRTNDNGIGVRITEGGATNFTQCYFEYHQISVEMGQTAQNNIFTDCYFTNNPGWSLIKFKSNLIRGNKFIRCVQGTLVSDINSLVIENNTDGTLYTNYFEDCVGFVLSNTPCTAINCISNVAGETPLISALLIGAGFSNPPGTEATNKPYIEGIGTSNAILHTNGFGEVIFGNNITANTTITKIDGLRPHQLLFIGNYQENYTITLKAGSKTSPNTIVLPKGDIVLSKYCDSVLLLNNSLSRKVELARSLASDAPARASVAPTSGTHAKGDIVWNAAPDAGEYVGWVCVTAGTPGTWKGFGTIEA